MQVGDVVDGRVTKVVPFGALLVVGSVPGLLVGAVSAPVGSTLSVRVAGIDPVRNRVQLEAV